MTIDHKKLMSTKVSEATGENAADVMAQGLARAKRASEYVLSKTGMGVPRVFAPRAAEKLLFDMAVPFASSEAWRLHDDDGEATLVWLRTEARNSGLMVDLMGDMTQRTSLWWCARWSQAAFPAVSLFDDKYAAALCTTTVPPDLVDMVRAPWRAFLIRVPAGLLMMNTGDGLTECVSTIQAHEHLDEEGDRCWSYVLSGGSVMMDRTCVPVREMCLPTDPEEFKLPSAINQTQLDTRSLHMAARLIIGVCMAFESEGGARHLSSDRKAMRRRGTPFPTALEYIVGRPVSVDARRYVREYIASGGKRGPRTTQSLVRGHWKHQPHGIGRSERKFIHIEPYWRGPEDAPIAVRPHVLGKQAT